MSRERLVLGTRGSALARAQSGWVAERVRAATGLEVELRVVRTRGDRVLDRPLAEIGGKGLFTEELERELRAGGIDFAVHSLKDLPTDDAPGLVLGAVPEREDPRDALVGAPLDALPAGAVVGTGSLRRAAQLRALRPDLEVRDIRGNVDTRLRKRDEGRYDVVVLAMAGMRRLGIARQDVFPFDVEAMVPAVGQGALAVQCRADDDALLELLARIEDAETRRRVEAERAFLAAYGGGCNVPVACHATVLGDGRLRVVAVGPDGRGGVARREAVGGDGPEMGRALAAELRALGGAA